MIRTKYNRLFVYCDGCRRPLMATFRMASFDTYEEAQKDIEWSGWLTQGSKHYCHYCQNTGRVKSTKDGSNDQHADS